MFLLRVLICTCLTTTFGQLVLQPYGVRMCAQLRPCVNFRYVTSDLACHVTRAIKKTKMTVTDISQRNKTKRKQRDSCFRYLVERIITHHPVPKKKHLYGRILLAKEGFRQLSLYTLSTSSFSSIKIRAKVIAMSKQGKKIVIATEEPPEIRIFGGGGLFGRRMTLFRSVRVYHMVVCTYAPVLVLVEGTKFNYKIKKIQNHHKDQVVRKVRSAHPPQIAVNFPNQIVYCTASNYLYALNFGGQTLPFKIKFQYISYMIFQSHCLYLSKGKTIFALNISSKQQTLVWISEFTPFNFIYDHGYLFVSFTDYGDIAMVSTDLPVRHKYIKSGFKNGEKTILSQYQ